MKRKYKKYSQTDFANDIGIDQPRVSRLLSGKEKMSWPLAVVFAEMFGGTVKEWKDASPKKVGEAFFVLETRNAHK